MEMKKILRLALSEACNRLNDEGRKIDSGEIKLQNKFNILKEEYEIIRDMLIAEENKNNSEK